MGQALTDFKYDEDIYELLSDEDRTPNDIISEIEDQYEDKVSYAVLSNELRILDERGIINYRNGSYSLEVDDF